jgi:hypothetical protein
VISTKPFGALRPGGRVIPYIPSEATPALSFGYRGKERNTGETGCKTHSKCSKYTLTSLCCSCELSGPGGRLPAACRVVSAVGGCSRTPTCPRSHPWLEGEIAGAGRVLRLVSEFCALLDTVPLHKNSLRGDRSKRANPCCRDPYLCHFTFVRSPSGPRHAMRNRRRAFQRNVEAAGTVTCRRQHLPVRREVRPEEVRCLGPPPAVHSRPLPAAVRTVCPLSALQTPCIALVLQ